MPFGRIFRDPGVIVAPTPTTAAPSEPLSPGNPAMAHAWQRSIIEDAARCRDHALLATLRQHKDGLARVMRFIKGVVPVLRERATLVLRAIVSMARPGALVSPRVQDDCLRYLMLTAQHDDALQACPAHGLGAL